MKKNTMSASDFTLPGGMEMLSTEYTKVLNYTGTYTNIGISE